MTADHPGDSDGDGARGGGYAGEGALELSAASSSDLDDHLAPDMAFLHVADGLRCVA